MALGSYALENDWEAGALSTIRGRNAREKNDNMSNLAKATPSKHPTYGTTAVLLVRDTLADLLAARDPELASACRSVDTLAEAEAAANAAAKRITGAKRPQDQAAADAAAWACKRVYEASLFPATGPDSRARVAEVALAAAAREIVRAALS